MKTPTYLSILALSTLVFSSCTTPGTPRSSENYSSGNSGGGYFQRAEEDSWQDRKFRSGGY